MEFAVLFKYYSDIFLTARAWIVRTFLWSLSNNLAISLYFRFISRRYIITDSSIVNVLSLSFSYGMYISYEKLRDRTFTILESVIIYLREMNLKYSEIARLLERDQRNVRTIHARAVRKMSE